MSHAQHFLCPGTNFVHNVELLDSTSLGTCQAESVAPPHSLPVADALNCRCVGGSRCPGLGAQVLTPGGCLVGPGSIGPLLGVSGPGAQSSSQIACGAPKLTTEASCGFCTMAPG